MIATNIYRKKNNANFKNNQNPKNKILVKIIYPLEKYTKRKKKFAKYNNFRKT